VTLTLRHRFVAGTPGAPTLLLLHGTGGNEDDLLPLGETLRPGAARLSPRGQVLENGMPRFFRRLAEGVFDLDDLRARAAELAEFVRAARATYPMGDRPPIAVGLVIPIFIPRPAAIQARRARLFYFVRIPNTNGEK
jgi:phospholipase/carboxylesterase